MLNENDQIRDMLKKIRQIQETKSINHNQTTIRPLLEQDEMVNFDEDKIDSSDEEETKTGDEINFDGIKTIGFLKSQTDLEEDLKTQITTSIGEFIKASTLLLDSIDILVEDSRIVMTSETIKNPGIESLKRITLDTDDNDPRLEFVSGGMLLNQDIVTLLQTLYTTFNDNQIGRNKLITVLRGQI